MKLIVLGPPGAGKGTQAVRLAGSLGIPHISTGELFRANIKAETALGRKARVNIEKGQLVPDAVTLGMVFDRLVQPDCVNGFILDGFPRTMAQAVALEDRHPLDAVLDLHLGHEVLMNRLCGRRTCAECGRSFHIDLDDCSQCSSCGGCLEQRRDDTPETVERRLQTYNEQTLPLTAYYAGRGLLRTISADAPIDQVEADALAAVQKLPGYFSNIHGGNDSCPAIAARMVGG